MIIYAFDERFEPEVRRASSRETVSDIKIVTILESDSLNVAIDKIRVKARTEGNIWLLRIIAHAYPGRVLLGSGFVEAGHARAFSVLAPYFTPGCPGIEFHSCNLASSTPETIAQIDVTGATRTHSYGTPGRGSNDGIGPAFLLAIAQATGVNVTAGYDTQFVDRGFRWEGRGTTTVEPSGTTETRVGPDAAPIG